ncbi:hypothetical protein [Dongia rigui]|uniref:Uncharacterized protein n=1 Tax=Dongia rigui TaxID=940149 RepID=A0ABU5DXP8_9PROT|nr:hypothetical protein [Dongia rigui]MDY0872096.1 hypothetical protein [Dongia rigui]
MVKSTITRTSIRNLSTLSRRCWVFSDKACASFRATTDELPETVAAAMTPTVLDDTSLVAVDSPWTAPAIEALKLDFL